MRAQDPDRDRQAIEPERPERDAPAGRAKDPSGRTHEIRICSLNGYSLTVFSSLAIIERLIANGFPPGCWTPAAIMGKDFIFESAGNIDAGIAALNRIAERSNDLFTFLVL